MKKNKKSWTFVFSLFHYIQTYFRSWQHISQLFELETKLALKTFIHMFIMLYFLSFLGLAIWLSMLALFFLWLSAYLSTIASIAIVLAINVFIALILIIIMLIIKKNLSFNSTRRQWHNLVKR